MDMLTVFSSKQFFGCILSPISCLKQFLCRESVLYEVNFFEAMSPLLVEQSFVFSR